MMRNFRLRLVEAYNEAEALPHSASFVVSVPVDAQHLHDFLAHFTSHHFPTPSTIPCVRYASGSTIQP